MSDIERRLASIEVMLEELASRPVPPHAEHHELAGGDTVRLSVQNGGTQLNRQRTVNFGAGLTASESSVNKRIDVVLADHGAASHTNRTRHLFLSAQEFRSNRGSPAWAASGSWPDCINTIAFDKDSPESVGATFLIPEDWVSGAVTKIYWYGALKSGVVRWNWEILGIASGESCVGAEGNTSVVNSTASGVANGLVIATADWYQALTLAAGDLVRLVLYRNAANAADTYNADAYLVGVEIEYTADM